MQLGPDTSGTELIEGGPLAVLVRRPQLTGPAPAQGSPALVMLHGFGANEGDIYELVPFVDRRVLIAAPRGPLKVDDNPRGSWRWSVNLSDGQPDPAILDESASKLSELIEQLKAAIEKELEANEAYKEYHASITDEEDRLELEVEERAIRLAEALMQRFTSFKVSKQMLYGVNAQEEVLLYGIDME